MDFLAELVLISQGFSKIIEALSHFAWPGVALCILYLFQENLKNFIDELTNLKFGSDGFTFGRDSRPQNEDEILNKAKKELKENAPTSNSESKGDQIKEVEIRKSRFESIDDLIEFENKALNALFLVPYLKDSLIRTRMRIPARIRQYVELDAIIKTKNELIIVEVKASGSPMAIAAGISLLNRARSAIRSDAPFKNRIFPILIVPHTVDIGLTQEGVLVLKFDPSTEKFLNTDEVFSALLI